MNEAFIKTITYYLPETVLSNEQLVAEFPEWTVEKIASKVGVKNRHIAASDETAGDMAIKAAELMFAANPEYKNDVDFVILCTQSPDFFLPSTACIIQNKLGLKTECGAFDINLGCSGYEYGLAIAKGLIVSEIASNVLFLTAETYSKHIHPKDKGNRTIFGDGASATLVSTDGFARIGEFYLGTDGQGANELIHRTGAWRNRKNADDLAFDEDNNPHSSDYLFMDGRAIFDFTADAVPILVDKVLEKNRIGMDQVDLFVFHQANKYMINYLRKLMGIEKERFFVYLENVGNTVSSTVPIALCEAIKEGKARGNVLLAGFGVGLSYAGVLITIQ